MRYLPFYLIILVFWVVLFFFEFFDFRLLGKVNHNLAIIFVGGFLRIDVLCSPQNILKLSNFNDQLDFLFRINHK